jgi:hypothetical protein
MPLFIAGDMPPPSRVLQSLIYRRLVTISKPLADSCVAYKIFGPRGLVILPQANCREFLRDPNGFLLQRFNSALSSVCYQRFIGVTA